MADNPADARTKKHEARYSDPLNPTRTEPAPVSRKRIQLWNALSDFIHENGAWTTSVPGMKLLRLEVPQGSSLPAKLAELGYAPRHAGTGTRITSAAANGFMPVDVIEFLLGK